MFNFLYRDLTLDTQLELIRKRDFMEYTFHTLPDLKDGRFKGQWLNGKPHGKYVLILIPFNFIPILLFQW